MEDMDRATSRSCAAGKEDGMDERKEELGEEIARNIKRWNEIHENGGDDPFCEDGAVMNSIRKRIVMLKKKCEAELSKDDLPPEYSEETPQEVKSTYMVNTAQIKRQAKKVLKTYEESEDYLWLKKKAEGYADEQLRAAGLEYILHYPEALRFFIEKDLYVDMRRHVLNAGRYIASFQKGRERAKALPAPGAGRRKHGMKPASPQKEPLPETGRPYLSVKFSSDAHGQDKEQKKKKGPVSQKKTVSPAKRDHRPRTGQAAAGIKKEKTGKRTGHKSIPDGQLSLFDMGIA